MNYKQTENWILNRLPFYQFQGSKAYKPGLDKLKTFVDHLNLNIQADAKDITSSQKEHKSGDTQYKNKTTQGKIQDLDKLIWYAERIKEELRNIDFKDEPL